MLMAEGAENCAKLHALASGGLQQLQELVQVVRQMFAQLGYGNPADAVQRQTALQHRYTEIVAALRATLTECNTLSSQVLQEGGQDAQAATQSDGHASADSFPARHAALKAEVCAKNELIKQLIDQLRQMLESMSMWEAYKHQLERYKLAEGH